MAEDKCENVATIQRFWPGSEPDLVCVAHAMDSQKIAEAMGFPLVLIPVGVPVDETVTDLPTCCCSKGFSQTVEME